MEMKYFSDTDTLYISFSSAEVAETRDLTAFFKWIPYSIHSV